MAAWRTCETPYVHLPRCDSALVSFSFPRRLASCTMSPQLSALWRVAALGSERDILYVESIIEPTVLVEHQVVALGCRSSRAVRWGAAGVPGRDGPSCMRCILRPRETRGNSFWQGRGRAVLAPKPRQTLRIRTEGRAPVRCGAKVGTSYGQQTRGCCSPLG